MTTWIAADDSAPCSIALEDAVAILLRTASPKDEIADVHVTVSAFKFKAVIRAISFVAEKF